MNKSAFIIGGLLIFFGMLFLIESIGFVRVDIGEFISFMIPIGIISFGVWLIIRKKNEKHKTISVTINSDNDADISFSQEPPKAEKASEARTAPVPPAKQASPPPPVKPTGPAESPDVESNDYNKSDTFGRLRYSKLLGDMFIDCKGQNLNNVEISVGIGDLELKLNEGILSKGLNRVVISGFVGDIRIFISKETSFFSHCSNFIGDIDLGGQKTSGFGNTLEHNSPDYDQAESKLYVAANNFIGDIRVYQM